MSSAPGTFVSFSANFEDVYLHRVFGGQGSGFFVDIGAAHPTFENDTKALYDRGWRGINVEPNAGFFAALVAERPRDRNLQLAVGDRAGPLAFHEVVGTGLSTADAEEAARARAKGFEVVEHEVAADTLAHILEEASSPPVDLLKVDVEGYELKALASNDWSRFRPRLILVEATFPETAIRRPDQVTPFLAGHGYRHVFFDGLNDYYAEAGFDLPGEAFDRPVNVFDRFVTAGHAELRRAREFLAAQVASLEEERANGRVYASSLEEAVDRLKQERSNGQDYVDSLTSALGAGTREREQLARQARQNRHMLDSATGDLARATAEIAAMRDRAAAFARQLDAALLRAAEAEEAANRTRAELSHADAAMQAREQARDHQRQAAEAMLRAEIGTLARHRDEASLLRQTTSWRITRPLRAFRRPGRTLRILFGGGAE